MEGYICGAKKFEIKVPPIARKYTTPTQNCPQNPFLKSFLVRNDVHFSPIGLNKEKSTPGYPKIGGAVRGENVLAKLGLNKLQKPIASVPKT